MHAPEYWAINNWKKFRLIEENQLIEKFQGTQNLCTVVQRRQNGEIPEREEAERGGKTADL